MTMNVDAFCIWIYLVLYPFGTLSSHAQNVSVNHLEGYYEGLVSRGRIFWISALQGCLVAGRATQEREGSASPTQWKKELPMPFTSCKCDPVLFMLQICFATPDISLSRGFGGTSWQEARKLHFPRTSASSKSQKASKVPWVSTISSQPKYLKYLPRVENIDTAKENAPHSSSLPASREATLSHSLSTSSFAF